MFENNAKFQRFRERLHARGVRMRAVWQAKRAPECREDDIALFTLHGKPAFSAPRAVIVTSDPDGGYTLYFEDRGRDPSAHVDLLVRP